MGAVARGGRFVAVAGAVAARSAMGRGGGVVVVPAAVPAAVPAGVADTAAVAVAAAWGMACVNASVVPSLTPVHRVVLRQFGLTPCTKDGRG